jgi:hypothetical protein
LGVESILPRMRSRYRRFKRRAFRFYRRSVIPHIPHPVMGAVFGVYRRLVQIRLSPAVTRLLGPRYRIRRDRIELDIIWACNLSCAGCSRACDCAPTGEKLSVDQVRRFLDESRARGVKWDSIALMGGEPTLHPQLNEILSLVVDYKRSFSPRTWLRLSTNGCGKKVQEALQGLPPEVRVVNTAKDPEEEGLPDFVPFTVAPADLPEYAGADFHNLCSLARDCGTNLTPTGYYACVGAATIDRVFGFDLGRQELPAAGDDVESVLPQFCRLCGFFRLNVSSYGAKPGDVSPTWQRALEEWRRQPPSLTRFPAVDS